LCGIVGCVSKTVDERWLDFGLQSLVARGPDGVGSIVASDVVQLGHTRLALNGKYSSRLSDQPFISSCGNWIGVINGEMYNFRDFAPRQGNSVNDCEVFFNLACKLGPRKAINLIDGMYAFAIVDLENNLLYLGVDRFRQKPLYVSELKDGGIFFSSSPVPLMYPQPGENVLVDNEAVSEFFEHCDRENCLRLRLPGKSLTSQSLKIKTL
jgi:asparagine synthase (glutamine-hydrolysing)